MVAARYKSAAAGLALMSFSIFHTREAVARCAIELVDPTSDARWGAAVRAIEATGSLARDTDCLRILVSVVPEGADVTFDTVDGRSATRRIERPEELVALIEALQIADPAQAPATSPPLASRARESDRIPVIAPPPQEVASPDTASERGATGGWLIALGAGAKSGRDDDPSPYAQLLIAIATSAWEVGAFGRSNFEHSVELHGAAGHSRLGDAGGGIVAGRRQRVGALTILAGANAGLFAAWQKTPLGDDHARDMAARETFAQPRAGIYGGATTALWKTLLLRTQLDASFALARHEPSSAAMAPFPMWTVGLSIGVEAMLPR